MLQLIIHHVPAPPHVTAYHSPCTRATSCFSLSFTTYPRHLMLQLIIHHVPAPPHVTAYHSPFTRATSCYSLSFTITRATSVARFYWKRWCSTRPGRRHGAQVSLTPIHTTHLNSHLTHRDLTYNLNTHSPSPPRRRPPAAGAAAPPRPGRSRGAPASQSPALSRYLASSLAAEDRRLAF